VMMVCSLARIRLMIAMAPTHDQDGDCQVRGYACNLIYNYPHGVLTEAAASTRRMGRQERWAKWGDSRQRRKLVVPFWFVAGHPCVVNHDSWASAEGPVLATEMC
jgi:hypothetical protein